MELEGITRLVFGQLLQQWCPMIFELGIQMNQVSVDTAKALYVFPAVHSFLGLCNSNHFQEGTFPGVDLGVQYLGVIVINLMFVLVGMDCQLAGCLVGPDI